MAVPKLQLLSKTLYDTDGSTTVWDFNFEGGYILQDHIKAYTETPAGLRTPIVVTPGMLIGPWQLQITPALAAGSVLVIYRATPKDAPMVDFVDRGGVSEVALDTVARQAIFVAAEASDDVTVINGDVAVAASEAATTSAASAAISAATAVTKAAEANTSASNAATSAWQAATSAADALTAVAGLSDLSGSTTTGRAVLKAADPAAARAAIGAGTAMAGANSDITSLTALAAGGLPNNCVMTADIADAQVTPAKLAQPSTLGTSIATTSGTSVGFIGIPSWVKEIDIMWSDVSLSGSTNMLVQIGSNALESSGYSSQSVLLPAGSTSSGFNPTSGFGILSSNAANAWSGHAKLTLLGSNIWVFSSVLSSPVLSFSTVVSAGRKQLSGTLERLSILTANGSDTFDTGAVNIIYKG